MMLPISIWGERPGYHEETQTIMILEAQAAQHPDAIAGRALLTARLARLSSAEREAFHKAVRVCFASGALAAANENREIDRASM